MNIGKAGEFDQSRRCHAQIRSFVLAIGLLIFWKAAADVGRLWLPLEEILKLFFPFDSLQVLSL